MVKQDKSVYKKSMGRPPGIKYGGTIPARFELATMEALDAWADSHDVTRSEAIRRLVELGLSVEAPQRPRVHSTAKQSAARAVELAGNAIDKHSDQGASDDERSTRKRKLIQGPSVFRNARKDRPGKGSK
ncbi:MAG: hypothetical protein ABW006_06500 [Hyphomicrobium sp.]